MEFPKTKVLYSDENKSGKYLETLMDEVTADMHIKSLKLATLPDFEGKTIVQLNNIEIIRLLSHIKSIQESSMKAMQNNAN